MPEHKSYFSSIKGRGILMKEFNALVKEKVKIEVENSECALHAIIYNNKDNPNKPNL